MSSSSTSINAAKQQLFSYGFRTPEASLPPRQLYINRWNVHVSDMLYMPVPCQSAIFDFTEWGGSYMGKSSGCRPGGWFTNVSRALQNNVAKIHNTRNKIYGENFKLKRCSLSIAWIWAHVESCRNFWRKAPNLVYRGFDVCWIQKKIGKLWNQRNPFILGSVYDIYYLSSNYTFGGVFLACLSNFICILA